MADSDEYELIPEKEIDELKSELRKLKDFEVKPTKQLGTNLVELNAKIEQLLAVFEQSYRFMATEGGENKELIERLDKILEENSQIAQGLVALSDMVSELKDKVELFSSLPKQPEQKAPDAQAGFQFGDAQLAHEPEAPPPLPGMLPQLSEGLPPPPPPKRAFFG